jgi:rhamnogalacturonyl hydrolase YesR
MNIDNIIDDMKAQIVSSEVCEKDSTTKSWGYEEGVLLSVSEAKLIITHLENYFKDLKVKP